MSNDLKGKVIVITGGASGIGLATARLLSSRGARLSLADQQESALEAVAAEIKQAGGEIMVTTVDVRNRKQVDNWIEETVKVFGKLDGAANLAGVVGKNNAPMEDTNDDDWNFILGVNLTGVMYSMRAELKHMNDGGSLVSAASVAGRVAIPHQVAYNASKHGVIGIMQTAAREYGHRGIRANAIAPGPIVTAMSPENHPYLQNIALGRNGQVNEVAELIAWLLCDGSSYISGSTQAIDGGWVC